MTNEVELTQGELSMYKGLGALANSDGGKTLVENLKARIASDVETLRSLLKGSDTDIRAAIATLNADVYLFRTLLNADVNAKIKQEELEALLKKEEIV